MFALGFVAGIAALFLLLVLGALWLFRGWDN